MNEWLIDAADLLAEPDPGPTSWLIEDLIVDEAIVAAVGKWKALKSYTLKDLSISVATGRPAFGRLAIPKPGPVVFINEESGRKALWRRLDALCRGRAIDPEELRSRLFVAASAGLYLDDVKAQEELIAIGKELRPRLFVFDPLARMKSPARDENAQSAMATVIEYLRALRDESGAAVCFVHHLGHQGETMRGSSDLESVWESRLAWERDGESPLVTIKSRHREAEAAEPIQYRIEWEGLTRSMRFELVEVAETAKRDLTAEIVAWVSEHPGSTTNEVVTGVRGGRKVVQDLLKASGQVRFEPGGNRSLRWFRISENHLGHPEPLALDGGGLGGPSPVGRGPDEPPASQVVLSDRERARLFDEMFPPKHRAVA